MLCVQVEDFLVRVGRNQAENQELLDSSSAEDFWLHMADVPSAHAVISHQGHQKPSMHVLKQAALIIKQRSKQKGERVKFTCTKISHLRQTKTPGLVVVLRQLCELSLCPFDFAGVITNDALRSVLSTPSDLCTASE